HLASASPRRFRATATPRAAIEKPMKYSGEAAAAAFGCPDHNSALPATKYRMLGKYGRLAVQYVQPVMKAANGPKATRYHAMSRSDCPKIVPAPAIAAGADKSQASATTALLARSCHPTSRASESLHRPRP